jgi:hypothetical protein
MSAANQSWMHVNKMSYPCRQQTIDEPSPIATCYAKTAPDPSRVPTSTSICQVFVALFKVAMISGSSCLAKGSRNQPSIARVGPC